MKHKPYVRLYHLKLSLLVCSLVIFGLGCVSDADSPYDAGIAGEVAGQIIEDAMVDDLAGMTAGDGSSAAGNEVPVEINPPRQVSVATYNVQNLFDFINDPEHDEGEYTPNVGSWSRSTYEAKVQAIAEILILISADIVTLQEVESEEVLNDLAKAVKDKGGFDYQYRATSPSRDPRGIALGVLSTYPFDREIGRPISTEVACSNGESLGGSRPEARPVYEINFWSDGSGGGGGGGSQSLTLLVNHWKSRVSGDYPCQVREHHRRGALLIKDLLQGWFGEENERSVIVLGDFNAEESEPSLSTEINAYLNPAEVSPNHALYNVWGELGVTASSANNATNSTYRFEEQWFRLDHIMITKPMLRSGNGAWKLSHFEVIREARLFRNGSPYSWSSQRNEGFSDHLPLKISLTFSY